MSMRRRGGIGRALRLRPVESYKHVVDFNFVLDTQTGVNVATNLAVQRASQTLDRHAVASEVAKCRIPWMYYDLTISNGDTTGAADDFDAYIWNNKNGNLTAPVPGTTGVSENKPWICIEWKTKMPISDVLTKYVGVVKIPKKIGLMNLNDFLILQTRHTCATANIRGKFIYREIV